MKAVVYTQYGGPEMLSLLEVEKPKPKENEVLIHVRAASINDWDLGLLTGDSIVNRAMSGMSKPKLQILGSDVAGIVEEVGTAVTRFVPGDEVYGDLSSSWGGFAEYVCAKETSIAKKSPRMSFEEAAAIPQAGMLAAQALIDIGQIRPNQKILFNGAGGGVGTLGLQIAKQFGAEVTGVDSADKLPMMKAIGFDHVIDYRTTDFTKTGIVYDLIVDAKTSRSVFQNARAVKKGGRYVTVGGEIPMLLQTLALGPVVSALQGKKMKIVALKPNKDLLYMNELFEAGKLKPILDQTFPLINTREAMELYASGQHKGKVVITNP